MSKFDNKSNNEILLEMKQMELDFTSTKNQILKLDDKIKELLKELDNLEKDYNEANLIVNKRLKGNIN